MFQKGGTKRSSSIDTLVGRNTRISGDINFTGGLHVDGDIKGDVTAEGDPEAVLSISEYGKVEGQVQVPNVVLNGTVIGDVHTEERIELAPAAKVTGDVYYNLIEMAGGASVNGKLVHRPKQNHMLALEHGKRSGAADGAADAKPAAADDDGAAGKSQAGAKKESG